MIFRVLNRPAIHIRDFVADEDMRMEKNRRNPIHVCDHVEQLRYYALRERGVERERMLSQERAVLEDERDLEQIESLRRAAVDELEGQGGPGAEADVAVEAERRIGA